ncbi:phosphate/phosphite/phosphonate ABC transporter substrate-binding protein, partial [Candidatus Bipolaricaulota bacterium]|nr:phosphate/phosphite/phosphonate ABC transporter substrate-binding protein [Candidatus Bipolaricaulota bacterium]
EEKTGKSIEFYAPTSYNGVIEAMRSDFVDIAGFGAFSYILAHEEADAEVFGARIDTTTNEQGYYSYMVTKEDSGIESLEDLEGKIFAYTDPGSTSGKLIPSYTFEKADIDTEEYLERTIFAGGHQSAVLAVKRGQVDAAAVASTVYQRMANREEIDKDNVVVFERSSLLPLAPQTYRADLCESLKEDIREAYFTFAEEAPNAETLLEPMGAKRFESMADSDFDRIRDIIEVMDVDVG